MIHFSFLLPCYNVEKYIVKCLDSIYAASLNSEEFEVLCYEDCSTDNTRELLQNYSLSHSNVKVLCGKHNVGLSAGRNILLNEAQGEYVWFIDSDDYLDSNNVDNLVNTVITNKLDTLLFNYKLVDTNNQPLRDVKIFSISPIFDGAKFVEKQFGEHVVDHLGYVWRFIVRKDFLLSQQIDFPEGQNWEDLIWVAKVLFYSTRIMSSESVGYIHAVNSNSISDDFHKNYRAKDIYIICIISSEQILQFINTLEEHSIDASTKEKYEKVFLKYISKLINAKLPLYLARTNHNERKLFYLAIRQKPVSSAIKSQTNFLSKLLFSPLGLLLSDLLSIIYSIKHR